MAERDMTMIERVAKALADDLELAPKDGGTHGCTFGGMVSPDFQVILHGHVDLLSLACAAIEELKNPTEPMKEALWQHTLGAHDGAGFPDLAWDYALQAALSETPPPSNPSAYQEP